MAKKTKKQQPGGTPATVALTSAGVGFTVHSYEHDPSHPSYGEEAAEAMGVSPTGSSRRWWRTWTAHWWSGWSRWRDHWT